MTNKKQVITDEERRESVFIHIVVFLAFVYIAALLARWAACGFKIVGQ